MDKLRLYDYSASANCYKVRLLLAQLGRPYERVAVDIFDGQTLTAEFERINPLRSTPALQLTDGEVLTESAAILAYLARGSSFLPDEPWTGAHVLKWLFIEQTEVIPAIGGLRFRLVTERLAPTDPEAKGRRRDGELLLDMLEHHLSGRTFFVAEAYTIADIALYGYLHVAEEAGYDLASRPALLRWLRRVAQQPGHIDDLVPYPRNARPGAGRSIYD
jgi:glutathione S-transferase